MPLSLLLLFFLAGWVDPRLDPGDTPRPAATASAAVPPPPPSAPASVEPVRCASTHECATPLVPPPPQEPPEAPPDAVATPGACPPEMVLVLGDYCFTAQQDCLEWMDSEIPLAARKRCARFAPTRCLGEKKHMRFCIDRLEHARTPDDLPTSDLSWTMAREQCEAQGKRLCYEQEWTLACEGPDMLPYPYGLERDASRCNHDRMDLVAKGKMLDHRHKASDHADCKSPYGVVNMVGNVDEWVWLEKGYPPQRSGLKGGWWLAGRNRCRPTTGGHDEHFREVQTGFRCCKGAT